MSDMDFGLKVAEHLSASNRSMDARVLAHLRKARLKALSMSEHQRPGGWRVWSSTLLLRFRLIWSPSMPSFAGLLLVLALFFAGGQWSDSQRPGVKHSIDTALLIDDLPIEAYLDPEFRAWLSRESPT